MWLLVCVCVWPSNVPFELACVQDAVPVGTCRQGQAMNKCNAGSNYWSVDAVSNCLAGVARSSVLVKCTGGSGVSSSCKEAYTPGAIVLSTKHPDEAINRNYQDKYFLFNKAVWTKEFGVAPAKDSECKQEASNWRGKHGNEDVDVLKGPPSAGACSLECTANKKCEYFVYRPPNDCFLKQNFARKDAATAAGTMSGLRCDKGRYQNVKQIRDGGVVWTGTVAIWDNKDGIYGRRDAGAGKHQWAVQDRIVPVATGDITYKLQHVGTCQGTAVSKGRDVGSMTRVACQIGCAADPTCNAIQVSNCLADASCPGECTHFYGVVNGTITNGGDGGPKGDKQCLSKMDFAFVRKGYCSEGYYTGNPALGATLASCESLCRNEPDCKYFSLATGKACRRYDLRAGSIACTKGTFGQVAKKGAPKWRSIFTQGSYGNDVGSKEEFNNAFISGFSGIIRRECARCSPSHKDVYFKRHTRLPIFDAYGHMLETWSSTGNVMGTDFGIYSSFTDAVAGVNPWRYCNYDDPGVAFPRDCGPTRPIGGQWNSLTIGGQLDIRFSVYTPATGAYMLAPAGLDACPVGSASVPKASCASAAMSAWQLAERTLPKDTPKLTGGQWPHTPVGCFVHATPASKELKPQFSDKGGKNNGNFELVCKISGPPQQFALGKAGADACPLGYVSITEPDVCQQGAGELGFTYDGTDNVDRGVCNWCGGCKGKIVKVSGTKQKAKWLCRHPNFQLGPGSSSGCPAGASAPVGKSECELASAVLLPGGKKPGRKLMSGSWKNVPPGCSMQKNDLNAYFNSNTNGINDGAYTKVCPVRATCNYQCYLDRYADLRKAFGTHGSVALAKAKDHWLKEGRQQGHVCTCSGRGRNMVGYMTRSAKGRHCNSNTQDVLKEFVPTDSSNSEAMHSLQACEWYCLGQANCGVCSVHCGTVCQWNAIRNCNGERLWSGKLVGDISYHTKSGDDLEIELSGPDLGPASTNLQRCTGECDYHHNCAPGLKCFFRSLGEKIPGCKGEGLLKSADYCFRPGPETFEGM